MKRRTMHAMFATVAVICAAAAARETARLSDATRVNDAIVRATALATDSSLPEAQFARAAALARTGKTDAALKAYKALAQGDRADLRIAALYNLGNLHIREAERAGADDPTQSLPLIELAKQSYRDVLRAQPADWDTRYNLERALQLAPELDDAPLEEEEAQETEEHVSSTVQGARMDLP
jgi:mxaK protein